MTAQEAYMVLVGVARDMWGIDLLEARRWPEVVDVRRAVFLAMQELGYGPEAISRSSGYSASYVRKVLSEGGEQVEAIQRDLMEAYSARAHS